MHYMFFKIACKQSENLNFNKLALEKLFRIITVQNFPQMITGRVL